MSSSQNQAGGSSQNHQHQQKRAQPLLRQFHNEYAAVGSKQFMKTGFLPPPEPINLGIDDGDNEVFQPTNTSNYSGRGLNPLQEGFEREAYKNPELHDLPPPPGDNGLPLPPPGNNDLPPPPGQNDLPPPPGDNDLPPPPG